MSILITGGAGFIGGFTAKRCAAEGRRATVLDNLCTGRKDRIRWGAFHQADIRDGGAVREALRANEVTTVVHLAALAHVGESIADPARYFSTNVTGTAALLDAMLAENVRRIVFASSCSVYGNTTSLRLREDHDVHPASPYGETKMACERMLSWYAAAYGIRFVALRYFNVAGADAESDLGEDIETSLRIVPRAMHAALQNAALPLFGVDFDTIDGTAVRDYIHVTDVADANLRAIDYLEGDGPSFVTNLGTGIGVSVRQIATETGAVLGKRVQVEENPRRAGDVPYAVADASRAVEILNWKPKRSSLSQIVDSVAAFARKPGQKGI